MISVVDVMIVNDRILCDDVDCLCLDVRVSVLRNKIVEILVSIVVLVSVILVVFSRKKFAAISRLAMPISMIVINRLRVRTIAIVVISNSVNKKMSKMMVIWVFFFCWRY